MQIKESSLDAITHLGGNLVNTYSTSSCRSLPESNASRVRFLFQIQFDPIIQLKLRCLYPDLSFNLYGNIKECRITVVFTILEEI